ncbi:hypothetical protein ACTGNR_11825 [Halococcus salifodinae]
MAVGVGVVVAVEDAVAVAVAVSVGVGVSVDVGVAVAVAVAIDVVCEGVDDAVTVGVGDGVCDGRSVVVGPGVVVVSFVDRAVGSVVTAGVVVAFAPSTIGPAAAGSVSLPPGSSSTLVRRNPTLARRTTITRTPTAGASHRSMADRSS